MVAIFSDFFFAKAVVYGLNAQDDAIIAHYILSFLETKKLPPKKDTNSFRAKEFIRSTKESAELFSIAYSLERINGLVDYSYAVRFAKRIQDKQKRKVLDDFLFGKKILYDRVDAKRRNIIRPWMRLIRRNMTDVDIFAAKNGVTFTYDRTDIINGIRTVQEKNIRENNVVADVLSDKKKSRDPKIAAIYQFSKMAENSERFLRIAARTEESASWWDKKLLQLL